MKGQTDEGLKPRRSVRVNKNKGYKADSEKKLLAR
jgi:hypothetical protein